MAHARRDHAATVRHQQLSDNASGPVRNGVRPDQQPTGRQSSSKSRERFPGMRAVRQSPREDQHVQTARGDRQIRKAGLHDSQGCETVVANQLPKCKQLGKSISHHHGTMPERRDRFDQRRVAAKKYTRPYSAATSPLADFGNDHRMKIFRCHSGTSSPGGSVFTFLSSSFFTRRASESITMNSRP